MRLDDIRKEVVKDFAVDPLDLDGVSIRLPALNGKYLGFLYDEKQILSKLKTENALLKKDLWLYFLGKLDDSVLQSRGWSPLNLKILRTDLDIYFDADPNWIKSKEALDQQTSKLEYLEGVLKAIGNKPWTIKNAIEFKKLMNGVH